MLREVEVGSGVDTFHFLEAERHLEFDVGGGVGIVGQLVVVVVAVFFIAEAESLVPAQTEFFPGLEPFHFRAGAHEKLHFHLFELSHAEDELAGHNLVTEGLANLSDTEGDAHAAGLLHVEIVDKDTLGCLRTQVNGHCAFSSRAHFGFEHEVELTHLCPVLGP